MKIGERHYDGWRCPECAAYYTWGDKMMACRGFVICSSTNKRHQPHEVVYAPERRVFSPALLDDELFTPVCLIRVEIAAE